MKKKKRYILYDTKDNYSYVCGGTVDEIARFTKETVNSIYCFITRKKKGNQNYLLGRYDLAEDEN